MIILDTDVLSLRQESADIAVLKHRLEQAAFQDVVCVTIISFEEQMRGWLDSIAKAKSSDQVALRYRKLRLFHEDYRDREIIDFDRNAIDVFQELKRLRLRLGTMDLKIGAICLANDAKLISRNLRDFQKIPGLIVEDWTQPT